MVQAGLGLCADTDTGGRAVKLQLEAPRRALELPPSARASARAWLAEQVGARFETL